MCVLAPPFENAGFTRTPSTRLASAAQTIRGEKRETYIQMRTLKTEVEKGTKKTVGPASL